MDKSNLELFKQAINEGLSNKIDKTAAHYTEEIVCSEKHKLAMRAIVYGKTDTMRVWSPKMKRVIAILVAAALLLTSCGIIFRNEIREVFEEFFIKLIYDGDKEANETIEEIYTLTYVPEGYILEKEQISNTFAKYNFVSSTNNIIYFEQHTNSSNFIMDIENGYSKIEEINGCNVYYRNTYENHIYIWSDEKYSMKIKSSTKLSSEELVLIIEGITTK